MVTYNSSEEFQRHKADVFAREDTKKDTAATTEKAKVIKVLDMYIKTHGSSVGVRAEAKKEGRDNAYQLDLSADLVTILEKIKSELR